MDLKISGAGTIASGEYDAIRVSGSASSNGFIRCTSLHASGAFSGHSDIECENDIHASGSFSNSGSIKAGSVHVSGSAKSGSLTAEKVHVSGSCKINGSLKSSRVEISGGLSINGDVEAENAVISGGISCDGMINAETLSIHLSNSTSKAASIGGSKIIIERPVGIGLFNRFFSGVFTVDDFIEGDEISIEHTNAKTVSGRSVKIGEGCRIDLVQYTDKVEISPKATVKKVEKL